MITGLSGLLTFGRVLYRYSWGLDLASSDASGRDHNFPWIIQPKIIKV